MLTYCTNIFSAETWKDTFHVLNTHILSIKSKLIQIGVLSKNEAFPIGLRLSARAASELLEGEIFEFKKWLNDNNCFIPTINGFPYGEFHEPPIKERVFQPDWADVRRLEYTENLFLILAKLSDSEISTSYSVSTLPASFKEFGSDEGQMLLNFGKIHEFLEKLSAEYALDFHLGLEPEPLGFFENTAETLHFFEKLESQFPSIKKFIGLNYDTCHFSLEYDDPKKSLKAFISNGIRISKIHASNAISVFPRDKGVLEKLAQFVEPGYLHQTIIRFADGSLRRFKDLPLALEFARSVENPLDLGEEWRIHFHIPLSALPEFPLRDTKFHLLEVLDYYDNNSKESQFWEIETYTWKVLPEEFQLSIEDQIVSEWSWMKKQLGMRKFAQF